MTTWITHHLAFLLPIVLTLLTGVGAEARWAAVSRFARWVISLGECQTRMIRWDARESDRVAFLEDIQEETRLLRETVAQTRIEMKDLIVQRDADRARIKVLEACCDGSGGGGVVATAFPTTPSSRSGPTSSAS